MWRVFNKCPLLRLLGRVFRWQSLYIVATSYLPSLHKLGWDNTAASRRVGCGQSGALPSTPGPSDSLPPNPSRPLPVCGRDSQLGRPMLEAAARPSAWPHVVRSPGRCRYSHPCFTDDTIRRSGDSPRKWQGLDRNSSQQSGPGATLLSPALRCVSFNLGTKLRD